MRKSVDGVIAKEGERGRYREREREKERGRARVEGKGMEEGCNFTIRGSSLRYLNLSTCLLFKTKPPTVTRTSQKLASKEKPALFSRDCTQLWQTTFSSMFFCLDLLSCGKHPGPFWSPGPVRVRFARAVTY